MLAVNFSDANQQVPRLLLQQEERSGPVHQEGQLHSQDSRHRCLHASEVEKEAYLVCSPLLSSVADSHPILMN